MKKQSLRDIGRGEGTIQTELPPEGDRGRLPRWAQREMDTQSNTIANLRRQLKSLEGAPEDSPVFIKDYVAGDTALPPKAHYAFQVRGGELEVTLVGDQLEIRGNDGRIAVLAHAANHIRVQVQDLFA